MRYLEGKCLFYLEPFGVIYLLAHLCRDRNESNVNSSIYLFHCDWSDIRNTSVSTVETFWKPPRNKTGPVVQYDSEQFHYYSSFRFLVSPDVNTNPVVRTRVRVRARVCIRKCSRLSFSPICVHSSKTKKSFGLQCNR